MATEVSTRIGLAVGELRDAKYWNPISSSWQSAVPSFPYNNYAGLRATAKNTSNETRYFYMYWYGFNAFGHREWQHVTSTFQLAPGGTRTDQITFFCNYEGTYQAICQLFEAYQVDAIGDPDTSNPSWGVPVAYVTGVPAVGWVCAWRFWDWESSEWVYPYPTVSLGKDIGIRGRACNEDPYGVPGPTQYMRMDAKIYPPTGGSYRQTGDVVSVPAGGRHEWEFIWEAAHEGDWYADLILYAGSELEEVHREVNLHVAHVIPEEIPPEEYAGTITKKELEYNGKQDPIPVAEVPIETRALVHIWGRNDTSVNQKLGLSWAIRDPDNLIIETGYDWETYHTGPNGQHHFILPSYHDIPYYLNLNKVGTYTIGIGLAMNPDNPIIVDDYAGDLCTVSVEVKYRGEIRNKLVDLKPLWPSGKHPIPYTAEPVEVGQKFDISFDGCNLSDFAMRLRGELWITSPTGGIAYNRHDVSSLPYGYDSCHEFSFKDIPTVDEGGTWTIRMELRNSTGEHLLAEWEGILFSTEILLKGDVGGHVKDAETGEPIEGAVVTVQEAAQSETTDSGGNYIIKDIPIGVYAVTAMASGYESATKSAVVVQNETTTTVNFELEKAVIPPAISPWVIGAGIAGAAAIGVVAYYKKKKKL